MLNSKRLLAGASGYSFKEWKGVFYPQSIKPDAMLAWYAERLPTVEINNTFYRMPAAAMLENWARATPAGFRFAIKASRPSCGFCRRTIAPHSSFATLPGSTTRSTMRCGAPGRRFASPSARTTRRRRWSRRRPGVTCGCASRPTRTKTCNNGAARLRNAAGATPSCTSCTSRPRRPTRRRSCAWRRRISVSRGEPHMAAEGLKASPGEGLKVYWRPGCSSCVRVKEFLSGLGVEYESVNVSATPEAMEDLRRLGVRTVPVVRKGDEYVFAQELADVSRFLGRD